MAQKQLKGVGGVLGSLISSTPADSTPSEQAVPQETPSPAIAPSPQDTPAPPAEATVAEEKETPAPPARSPATDKPRSPAPSRTPARRGRPPGRKAGEAVNKEKVTLRIDQELMDDYRDWSWEERCQLGELVERAMAQYRKQRRQKAGNA